MDHKCAFIFDMDGVVVDNAEYHYLAWEEFCKAENLAYERGASRYWFGNTNREILEKLYQRTLSAAEVKEKANMKEEIYRNMIAPVLKPVNGLKEFLDVITVNGFPVAMATSAPPENVDFILNGVGLRQYFPRIIDDERVKNGKPDPEIYLKAAEMLNKKPSDCIVFEDAIAGISSARRAGMMVVGLITTLTEDELKDTEMNIKDFSEIKLEEILKLFSADN